jgi:hypothetical protein
MRVPRRRPDRQLERLARESGRNHPEQLWAVDQRHAGVRREPHRLWAEPPEHHEGRTD